jgi:hypothetical protein
MSREYRVKLFIPSIVEGPGECTRGEIMLSVRVWAFSEVDARGTVEDRFTRLLQDELDGEIARDRGPSSG